MAGLFGNDTAEKVLLYLQNYGEGYARAIAGLYGTPLNMVQKQLSRFEAEGILVSRLVGRTRLYQWNPRYAQQAELRALLERTLALLPETEQRKYYLQRRRPRRAGKSS